MFALILTSFFFLFVHAQISARVAKLKNNVLNAWLPSTVNSVTTLNAVWPRRTKKLKLFGMFVFDSY